MATQVEVTVFMWSFLAILGLSGCSKNVQFAEEVQLASGEVLTLQREIKADALGEIGGPGGWEASYSSVAIAGEMPDKPPKWESTAGLVPIVLDKHPSSGEWTLLATFYTCDAWYRLGRPKLPYAEFRARNDQWEKVEFSQEWIGRPANVLTAVRPSREPKLVNLALKQERMSDGRIAPKYRSIVGRWSTGC